MQKDDDMKIFSGKLINNSSFNRQNKLTILCSECQKKFKEFLKNGGDKPVACAICQEKLKDQMHASKYPDRG